jgi:hypothetical protein
MFGLLFLMTTAWCIKLAYDAIQDKYEFNDYMIYVFFGLLTLVAVISLFITAFHIYSSCNCGC